MYDQIGVPREGCASFSDDGYPTSDSSNFGTAANQKQRDVPRAFLRSATHELTHTLNQIHQESGNRRRQLDHDDHAERGRRARRAGHRASPACSPIRSSSRINTTVRHHLNHMPDPVIRPGGWPFASWFPTGAPQAADRHDFAPSELALDRDGGQRTHRARPAAGPVVDADQHERRAAARAERREHRGALRVGHRHRRRGARASRAAVRDRAASTRS